MNAEVARHKIVVTLEPRFFLNMRPAKASIGCSIGQHAYNCGKNLGSLLSPRFNVALPTQINTDFLFFICENLRPDFWWWFCYITNYSSFATGIISLAKASNGVIS